MCSGETEFQEINVSGWLGMSARLSFGQGTASAALNMRHAKG